MSLKIEKKNTNPSVLALDGRLDTVTAPQLESELAELLSSENTLTLDMRNLEYISSAGLRVILKAQKTLQPKDGLKLTNVPESVKEVFDITGFSDFLTIE